MATAVKRPGSITGPQIQKIFVMARQLSIDNEALHGLTMQLTGKDSLRKLTKSEGVRLVGHLEADAASRSGKAGKKHPAYDFTPEGRREKWEGMRERLFVPEGVTPLDENAPKKAFQDRIIVRALKYFDQPEGVTTWLKHTWGIEKITTSEHAWKVYRTLEEMLQRKRVK